VVGTGFLVALAPDLPFNLKDAELASLARLGAHVVRFVPPGQEPGADDTGSGQPKVVADVDGVYRPWLASAGYEAVVIRPDFYVFGGVAAAADLPGLLDELFAALSLTPGPATEGGPGPGGSGWSTAYRTG
jgi:flavoprotein hydroxylase